MCAFVTLNKKITYLFGEKIVKIGPLDTEIVLIRVKKIKKKKLRKVKYIALSASLPSGLNYHCHFKLCKIY